MSLGKKIIDLRKKNGLSQEQLSEQLNITRQTISNWETEQTTPDINQAKQLSKIFKVSLDDLLDNDISNIMVEKINNTEKLAGMIIKILKIGGIILLVYFVAVIIIAIISVSIFSTYSSISESAISFTCNLNEENYTVFISTKGNYTCDGCSDKMKTDILPMVNYHDIDKSAIDIQTYFENSGGSCE